LPKTPPSTELVPVSDKALRTDLVLAGEAGQHRDLLRQLLTSQGWVVQWDAGGWSGRATKGNKTANFIFGAFAQFHELRFNFVTVQDHSTGLTVFRSGDGCMGGLYGMYKVKRSFKETSALVEGHFAASGKLLSSSGF
jgi:hypothetical protein